MKGTIRLDHFEKNIYISNPFAIAAKNLTSEEYKLLRQVQLDHPDYALVKREIKKNPNKESYCGLTYEYMDNYIASHDETGETMKIYKELRLDSIRTHQEMVSRRISRNRRFLWQKGTIQQ